jgi:integrase
MNPLLFDEYLKKKGLMETTIQFKLKIIRQLEKRFNLWESELVRNHISNSSWSNRRKNNVGYAYKDWCRWKGFDYQIDHYKEEMQGLPYVPLEKELDQLIAGFGKKYSCFLQLLKETGFRPIEALRLTPDDVDLERKVVTLNAPAKNSNPRQFKISNQFIAMVTPLIAKTPIKDRIWDWKDNSLRPHFIRRRREIAEKLGNPRLVKISMKTFRHWKATTEYHRTKDILYVKELLGHKSIKNTLVYTHLVSFEEENAFTVKVANNLDEFTNLLESGFDYVSDYEGKKILRKRK